MKFSEMKLLTEEQLGKELASMRQQLLRLNLMKKVSQIDKVHQFREFRRGIARLLTRINDLKMGKKT
ncbi:MAG: 50S ribosomal protein L29 [Puniceicoccales bacterium]|jgi:ribosomal protein L29|nr:50S ribosomal protein L29 [Puniceicoccales bacterium]